MREDRSVESEINDGEMCAVIQGRLLLLNRFVASLPGRFLRFASIHIRLG